MCLLAKPEDVRLFLEGHYDLPALVKKCYYDDLLEALRLVAFKDLSVNSSLNDFIKSGASLYDLNHRLNIALILTDNKFDRQCMFLTACEIKSRYTCAEALKDEDNETLAQKIYTFHQEFSSRNIASHEGDLIALLHGVFSVFSEYDDCSDLSTLKEILTQKLIGFMETASTESSSIESPPESEKDDHTAENIFSYLAKLRDERNFNNNSLGKAAYVSNASNYIDANPGRLPTKEVLIRLILALELTNKEFHLLLQYAKNEVASRIDSNRYSFEATSGRDKEILHWLMNIPNLKKMAKEHGNDLIKELDAILCFKEFDQLDIHRPI